MDLKFETNENKRFNFNMLDYGSSMRFIELLSVSNGYSFSLTNKSNYIECITSRKILVQLGKPYAYKPFAVSIYGCIIICYYNGPTKYSQVLEHFSKFLPYFNFFDVVYPVVRKRINPIPKTYRYLTIKCVYAESDIDFIYNNYYYEGLHCCTLYRHLYIGWERYRDVAYYSIVKFTHVTHLRIFLQYEIGEVKDYLKNTPLPIENSHAQILIIADETGSADDDPHFVDGEGMFENISAISNIFYQSEENSEILR